MYADDILLLSPSVTALQDLLHVRENVLNVLDLYINPKKSVCMLIGPRCNKLCCDIVSSYGYVLQWVDSIRYLGVHCVRGRYFKCNLDNAKASFYRAFNAVYGRIGRSRSEEVILQLIRFKCMPCLLYALEACPVNKTQLKSLEFTLNRVLMKVFRTTSMDVIAECRYWFGLVEMETLIAKLIAKRKQRFMAKYVQSDNVLCQLFAHVKSV